MCVTLSCDRGDHCTDVGLIRSLRHIVENYDPKVEVQGGATSQGFWFGCTLDATAANECQHKLVSAFAHPEVGLSAKVGKGTATLERPRSAQQQGVLRLRLSELSAEACGWLGIAPTPAATGQQTESPSADAGAGTWFAPAADGSGPPAARQAVMKPTQGFLFIRHLGSTTTDPVLLTELLSLRVLSTDAVTGAVSAESMVSVGKGSDLDLCAGSLGRKLVDTYMGDDSDAEVAVELCRFVN